jgi:glycosyltransferase involved in cell wall biosynthesis
MRLAFLTHEPFYPPSGGGSAEAIYLIEEFVRRGHEIHLFCPAIEEPRQIEQRFQIHLHQFNVWQMGRYTSLRTAKYLMYPGFLARMVERRARPAAFDLIFSQHAVSAVAAGWLKSRLKIPVVMNFLDYLTAFMETWPAYLAPPPLLAILKRFELSLPSRYRADGVLTVSDTLADYFATTGYPRERIRPIYFGFDANLFPFQPRRFSMPNSESPVIVMHGSLDHHHLGPIALEAMRYVSESFSQATFRFVGHRTGPLDNFVNRLKEKAPAARIECTGFVEYSKVARHLEDADLGIVPYEQSTGTHCAFVAKIVEYLAVGLPVVSTPLDSAQRYFKREPMVRFSQFDGVGFGKSIVGLLREPRERIAEAAALASRRVSRELDWRPISKNAIDFVEEIVAASHGSA